MRGVDFIFHAAALKQVPSCEFFPMEAVRTNIVGTDNVLTAAIDAGVKRIVCLSTDKAAYPINAMGISKAMMEKVIRAKARKMCIRDSSCIPWVSFTGMNLNLSADRSYYPPIFTVGKYHISGGRCLLPVAVQVHHAVCDGFHAARIFSDLEPLAHTF